MKSSVKIFLIFFILALTFNGFAAETDRSYNVRPADLTDIAPHEYNHISNKKQDSAGGLYMCLKTAYWKNVLGQGAIPVPKYPCNYILKQEDWDLNHIDITPSPIYLDKFRGPDVLNPCASLGSKYTNNYWDHGVGNDEGLGINFKDFCKTIRDNYGVDNKFHENPEKNKTYTLLASLIFPNAFAQTYSSLSLSNYKSCNSVFKAFERSGNSQLNKDDAISVDSCISSCETAPPTLKARQYCGVDECISESASMNKPSDWCCTLADYWHKKPEIDINPLAKVRKMCDGRERENLQYCLRSFSTSGKMPQTCCKYSTLISNYSPKAGQDVNRYCGSYNAAKQCLAIFDKKGVVDNSCCTMNYNYSGKIEFAPLMENYSPSWKNYLYRKINDTCNVQKVVKDNNVQICAKNIQEKRKPSVECCIAYHTGDLIPNMVGLSYSQIEKFCYPEKY
ncbi:MAG TPA: hypothetical protein DIV86_01965 [Alphaproteobacteria bacterium]|nr:hypothetical protein [Alphaproteobacteria bacterium]